MKFAILGTACWVTICAAHVSAADHSAATRNVVMSHMRAVGQLDVDAYVAGYAEDAKIVTTSLVYSGHDGIREFAEAWFAEFSRPDVAIEMQSMIFEGDTAIVIFSADTPENVYDLGVETFFVAVGKIVTQTYVVDVSPK